MINGIVTLGDLRCFTGIKNTLIKTKILFEFGFDLSDLFFYWF